MHVAIPASGTDVEVKLGFRETSLWEVFQRGCQPGGLFGTTRPDYISKQQA